MLEIEPRSEPLSRLDGEIRHAVVPDMAVLADSVHSVVKRKLESLEGAFLIVDCDVDGLLHRITSFARYLPYGMVICSYRSYPTRTALKALHCMCKEVELHWEMDEDVGETCV